MKDIPISKVIELSKNYNPRQIESILTKRVCDGVFSSEVITIYEHATKLEDKFIFNFIFSKYNLSFYYNNDFRLPELTLEEANAVFDEIYCFIYNVAQPKDIKMKNRYYVSNKQGGTGYD